MLPPTRAIALVEFNEPSHARAAFRRLAYRRFKEVPLYLEWAPIMDAKTAASKRAQKQTKQEDAANATLAETMDERRKKKLAATKAEKETAKAEKAKQPKNLSQLEAHNLAARTNTLHVANLPAGITEKRLLELFSALGAISAVVCTRSKPGQAPCYAFVLFKDIDSASNALQQMQGAELADEGAALSGPLELAFSRSSAPQNKLRSADNAALRPDSTPFVGSNGDAISFTKLAIKNVAFEATEKELRELFSVYGEVKEARIPKKANGQTRGFGFVEFATPEEADNARKALQHTHFYGRHLVIDFARDVRSIEGLQEQAARKSTATL